MPVTSYYSVSGRIIGQRVSGSNREDFLTDAVGSVTATVDASGAVVNRYRYKPHGGLQSKTGTGPDPKFQWVGEAGYRVAAQKLAYLRTRHYNHSSATLTSKAPPFFRLHYGEGPYTYAFGNPTTNIDPYGQYPMPAPGMLEPCPARECCCCATGLKQVKLRSYFKRNLPAPAGRRYRLYDELGFSFKVLVGYAYKFTGPGEPKGDCTLQYLEKSNIPLPYSNKQDEWVDQFTVEELKKGATLRAWLDDQAGPKPCPGERTVIMPEGPSLTYPDYEKSAGLTSRRHLCIKVVLKSSPGCQCKYGTLVLTMFIVFRIGPSGPLIADFKSPYTGKPCD